MRAQMPILTQTLELTLAELADRLGRVCGIVDDAAFELEELAYVAVGGRMVPRLQEGRRSRVALGAQFAILGDEVVGDGDPGRGQRRAQRAGLVGPDGVEEIGTRLRVADLGQQDVDINEAGVHGATETRMSCNLKAFMVQLVTGVRAFQAPSRHPGNPEISEYGEGCGLSAADEIAFVYGA